MDAVAVISECASRGLTLQPDGDALVVRPSALLDDELRAAIRTNKVEVLTRLREKQCTLLVWAKDIALEGLTLPTPITFKESPPVSVTTDRVSFYAAKYLTTIVTARTAQETGGWGQFAATWHRGCEREALAALQALRDAIDTAEEVPGGHDGC